jgi:serine/threonine-protein kinase
MSNDLSGYEFIQAVGKGAMGSVYLARQTALNRLVAIKQVLGAWNGDPQALDRFRREARALAKMNHPNVVGIYNLEAAGSDLYMIQEYVHGPTLKQILGNGRLSTGQAMRVIGEVSAALEYAAKQGILHRDLKPGNLFVTTAGVCKLGDFGLVKMIGGQSSFVTQVGTIMGTPSYMSPEQASGKAEIDQRTDVYSLAVMTYELLVGRLPFPPVPGNVMATVEAQISTPPPRPSQVAPGFPGKVEEVILAALAKDPKKRPKSAGEFWVKLASAGQRAWPGWAGESDLSTVAGALAPPPPTPQSPADRTTNTAAAAAAIGAMPQPPVPVPDGPPPASSPQQWTISPVDTTAFMAGSEETIVQGGPQLNQTDETVVQPPPPPPPPPPVQMPVPAAIPVPAAMPNAAAFSVPQVSGPVYKPPKAPKKRRLGRTLVLLILLAIIALGAFLVISRNSGPAVAVTAAEARVQAPQGGGHCPSATYVFLGTIRTNGGAGDIRYQWIQPDGTPASVTDQSVDKGQGAITVSLSFTYSGNGSTSGTARLKVLKPQAVDSNPVAVQYRCP